MIRYCRKKQNATDIDNNFVQKSWSRVIVYLDIKVSDERCQVDDDDVPSMKQ